MSPMMKALRAATPSEIQGTRWAINNKHRAPLVAVLHPNGRHSAMVTINRDLIIHIPRHKVRSLAGWEPIR